MPAELQALRRLLPARKAERCELCGIALPPRHIHLWEVANRRLACACQPCAILFDHRGQAHYRRIPDQVRCLPEFALSDSEWESLMIPIGLAFFVYSTPRGRVLAMYPGPAGATESLLPLPAWDAIADRNSALRQMEPDVEALLVNRVGNARDSYLVPIDRCYQLAGIIRVHWRGLSGGEEVWREINAFFADLRERSIA